MKACETDATGSDLISVGRMAKTFLCSDDFARGLMRRLDIPRRGGGYSARRMLVALGFVDPFPTGFFVIHDAHPGPLVDANGLTMLLGEAPRTVRRRLSGTHPDQSFPQVIHLGASTRLVMRDELDAWMHGIAQMSGRDPARLHRALKPDRNRATTARRKTTANQTGSTIQAASVFARPTSG